MNNMAFQAENGESFIASNTEKSYLCCARRQSEMFGNEILENFFPFLLATQIIFQFKLHKILTQDRIETGLGKG